MVKAPTEIGKVTAPEIKYIRWSVCLSVGTHVCPSEKTALVVTQINIFGGKHRKKGEKERRNYQEDRKEERTNGRTDAGLSLSSTLDRQNELSQGKKGKKKIFSRDFLLV